MERLPFSAYDFFGYLASGFLLLVAFDFAFDLGWAAKGDLNVILALFWVVVAYITGHIVAHLSSALLEDFVVREALHPPEEILLTDPMTGRRPKIFRGFYRPLPDKSRARLLAKTRAKANLDIPGRALFYHCHPIVMRDAVARERLDTFLNLYGFSRNVALSLLFVAVVLAAGAIRSQMFGEGIQTVKLAWAGLAIVGAGCLFFRYLKFFRHYTSVVFVTYTELD